MFTSICTSTARLMLTSLVIGSMDVSLALQIGIVDRSTLIDSPTIQAIRKPHETKLKEGQKEFESLLIQIQKLKEAFDKNQALMDAKTRDQQEKSSLALNKQLQTKMVNLERERYEINQQLKTIVKDACIKVAKQNKLDLILSGEETLYAEASLDVTTQVLEALPGIASNTAAHTA